MKLLNPYDLLEKSGITKSELNESAAKILLTYDKTKSLAEKYPSNLGFQESFAKSSQLAYNSLDKEIKLLIGKRQTAEEAQEKEKQQKQKSKEILAKSDKMKNTLDECRERLREDRLQKIESGEIKPPQKKTILTKIKDYLTKVPALIPEKLKDDVKVIQRTQEAVMKFLSELKKIWGLNKIGPIEDEIMEKFSKMEDTAAK